MSNNELTLDAEAQKLYALLGGLEEAPAIDVTTGRYKAGLAEVLSEEEKRLDGLRGAMAETIHQLVVCLADSRYPEEKTSFDQKISRLQQSLTDLAKYPNPDGRLWIRYRGIGAFDAHPQTDRADYVAWLGYVMLDQPTLQMVVKRGQPQMASWPDRLSRDFQTLEALKINTLILLLSPWGAPEIQRVGLSLQTLRRYYLMTISGASAQAQSSTSGPPPIILDEHRQPNPNLTLLANLNNLKKEAISALVQKVQEMMKQPEASMVLDQYATVHEAIFAFKNLKSQLVPPPLEINNLRWMIMAPGSASVSKNEIKVARTVIGQYADAPQKAAQVVEGVYGKDYHQVGLPTLTRRLTAVSDFLNELPKDTLDKTVQEEVLRRLEESLRQVNDAIMEKLAMPGLDQTAVSRPLSSSPPDSTPRPSVRRESTAQELPTDKPPPEPRELAESVTTTPATAEPEAPVTSGTTQAVMSESGPELNDKIIEMVTFFKARTGAKRKIQELIHKDVAFEQKDFEVIARDFDVTPIEASELVTILRNTFHKEGRFSRTTFQNSLPFLARHGTKVFDFLWSYLKEIENREDRVAFLNAMGYLISQLNQPKAAVEMLLTDLVNPADDVTFHDRNCLMLANVLVRTYNKELTTDIEITPEEVIQVWDGLNKEVVSDLSVLIDRERDKFFLKIRSIHQKTRVALDGRPASMPLRYLFTLEREAYMFFSLVGGDTARTIVKSAVNEFGDPDSEVYHLAKSQISLKAMLQILQLALRGLSRFKVPEDRGLLNLILSRETLFIAMAKDRNHHEQVRRVLRWAAAA